MDDKSKELIVSLAKMLAEGRLPAHTVLPVIKSLTEGVSTLPSAELLQSLSELGTHERVAVEKQLRDIRRQALLDIRKNQLNNWDMTKNLEAELGDLPLIQPQRFQTLEESNAALRELLLLQQDSRFLKGKEELAPEACALNKKIMDEAQVKNREHNYVTQLFDLENIISELKLKLDDADGLLLSGLSDLQSKIHSQKEEQKLKAAEALEIFPPEKPADVSDTVYLESYVNKFEEAEDQEKILLLDYLLSWPAVEIARSLLELTLDDNLKQRLCNLLTLRFGEERNKTWENWQNWLMKQFEAQQSMIRIGRLDHNRSAELLCIYAESDTGIGEDLRERLEVWIEQFVPPVNAFEFVNRVRDMIPRKERDYLCGEESPEEKSSEEKAPKPKMFSRENIEKKKQLQKEASVEEKVERKPIFKMPSIWEGHVKQFLAESWYMVAGILMVVVGASVLAYYTWEEHWLIRYTIMPALLGGFTFTLAWFGSWIEKRSAEFRSTATLLRTAAIALLPINFMAVTLLADDPAVTNMYAMPVMGLLYLLLGGWGLMSWTAAVQSRLKYLLGVVLLLLNMQVLLGPLASRFSGENNEVLLQVLGLGFYLGFAALAFAVIRFGRSVLTREMIEDKTVPLFFGGTLLITYLQVFAWVHGSIKHLPEIYTYAPMMLLSGGLVLFVERRILQLKNEHEHRAESFIGFALVLLGVLMGVAHEKLRILVFLMAAVIWLYQSLTRKNQIHYWIGLSFLLMSVSSVALLTAFPGRYSPLLGFALLGLLGILAISCQDKEFKDLGKVSMDMQIPVLVITAIISVLCQWHYNSPPFWTAGSLMVVAAFFAWRARRDQNLRWVHLCMATLGLTLPYLGCVDLAGKTLDGNSMVFGLAVLSFLWMAVNYFYKSPLILKARSTVLWLYGAVAVTAMFLRVIIESHAAAANPLSWQAFMDHSGPLMMTVVLIFTTYYSRSLIPAIMATIIAIILFPELKAAYHDQFENLGWGSGLGSTVSGLALISLCFPLRRWNFLKDMTEGDRFLGRYAFPLKRFDHTLFTLPIIGAVLFFAIKMDTLILARKLDADDMVWKSCLALGLSGVTWTLLGIYKRDKKPVICTHLGWMAMLGGVWFIFMNRFPELSVDELVLICFSALTVLYSIYYFLMKPHYDWAEKLLVTPVVKVLRFFSLAMGSFYTLKLLVDYGYTDLKFMMIFLMAQLLWHGYRTGRRRYGNVLFFATWMSCVRYLEYLESPINIGIYFFLLIQIFHLFLEQDKKLHNKGKGIFRPFQILSSHMALIFGLAAMAVMLDGNDEMTFTQLSLIFVLCVLTARAQKSGPFVFLAMLLAYGLVSHSSMLEIRRDHLRWEVFTSPWRLATFALCMSCLMGLGQHYWQYVSRFLKGQFSSKCYRWNVLYWVYVPAIFFVVISAWSHVSVLELRQSTSQWLTPYLGALSLAVIAFSWKKPWLFAGSGLLIILANVLAVNLLFDQYLNQFEWMPQDLSSVHLFCMGLILSLLQLSLLRQVKLKENVTLILNQVSLTLAALILVMLSVNYFVRPNIEIIEPMRFVFSGLMAYLSGLYMRQLARHSEVGMASRVCEGFYHYGVAMGLMCLVLIWEPLRSPNTVLFALVLPVLYFYFRAETKWRASAEVATGYRHSATVLSFLILTLYVFKSAFHLILFPELEMDPSHYHYNAPFMVILGLILLRLKGLGGNSWLSFYGGLAVIGGSYFTLTWFPQLSPFQFRVHAAWVAIALGHFWTLAVTQQSPIRSSIQYVGRLSNEEWFSLRRSWGLCLLFGTQLAVIYAFIKDYQSEPLMMAPLLLGAASIVFHHGALRSSLVYYVVGAVQVFLALHTDFFRVDSYLASENVVWVLLGLWFVALLWHQRNPEVLKVKVTRIISLAMALIVFFHVFYLDPTSTHSLWAFSLMILCAAFTPRPLRKAKNAFEQFEALCLYLSPLWIILFLLLDDYYSELFTTTPWLALTAGLFALACLARLFQSQYAGDYQARLRSRPRLFDHSLELLSSYGNLLNSVFLYLSFASLVFLQVKHYGSALDPNDLVMMMSFFAALSYAFFKEGQLRKNMLPYILMQLSVLAFFAVIRRHLMLSTDFWNHKYDVWASLAVSFCLSGAKQIWDLKPKEIRTPMMGSLFLLPVVAIVWTLIHGMGSDVALMVVGLHSLMFLYMGKDDKESPLNVIAIFGFVAFVLIVFWSKLQLAVIYAYVVPVGLGVLVLLQIFGQKMQASLRNHIRLVTLMAMIASSAWYALIDESYPLIFNLSLIVLCLLAMGLGSFLKIRLYLVMGFCGLGIDLISIVYKFVAGMQRSSQMSAIGALVLLMGASLVFGAIYYKANKEKCSDLIDRWRQKLGAWE